MRARWLKPEFFKDKKIGKMGPVVGLVYQALWCMADDGGTSPSDPELVKGEMFMYWPAVGLPEISDALEQLAESKRITRYHVGDEEFAILVYFDRHQAVHKPSLFRHPLPPQAVTAPKDDRLRHGCGTSSEMPGTPHILDTYTPRLLNTPEFDVLRSSYPKRSGGDSKQDALKEYRARLKQGATHEEIASGVRRYKAYCDATGKTGTEYVKQMRTFLGPSRHYLEPWTIPATLSVNGRFPNETPAQYQARKRGYVS